MSCMEIVEYIKKTPVLWKRTHRHYRLPEKTKLAWEQMAKDLNTDEILLRKHWVNLSTYYRTLHRRVKLGSITAESIGWKYYKPMEFLGKEISFWTQFTPRYKRDGEINMNDKKTIEYETDALNRSNCDEKCTTDPDMLFAMSILPLMKKLTLIQKLHFRRNISKWFLDVHAHNSNMMPTNSCVANTTYLQTVYTDIDNKEHIVIQQIQ